MKAQQSFQPLLKFKAIGKKTVKMRLVPRDYFEFKAIGNTGLKIEINTLGPKTGRTAAFTTTKRTIIYDTLSMADWKLRKMTPQLAIVNQLLKGKPQMYGATLTEQIANAKKIQDNTFIMALLGSSFSWDAAIASRTGIELSLSADSTYLISVSLLRNTPYALSDSSQVFANYIGEIPQKEEISLPFLSAEGFEKRVQLFWPENQEYLAYHIETSNLDGSATELLTKTPYFNQNKDSINNNWNYTVNVEKNYIPKRYRLLGFDLFGDSLNYSPWVTSYGMDKTPPKSVSKLKSTSNGPQVARVSWELPLDIERDNIVIYYSHNDEKPEVKIAEISRTDTVYIHDKADNILPNYYWVFTRDTAGNLGGEFPISVVTYDTIPPSAPEILKNSIDSNGLVTLIWNTAKDTDVHGYKIGVVRSNGLQEKPITLNDEILLDTVFQELLPPKKIQGDFYYAVRAKDLKGNYGPWSALKPISIPDMIPPSFVRIESLTPTEMGSLMLKLNLPNDKDASSLRIRKIIDSKDTSDWVRYDLTTNIEDKEVSRKHRYQYWVQTVDDAGNHSALAISPNKSPFPKLLNTENVKFNFSITKKHQIDLSISSIPKETIKIRLFKSSGVEPFYEIGQIDLNSLKYTSEKLPLYTVHRYGIVFEDIEGNKSKRIETEAIYIKEVK